MISRKLPLLAIIALFCMIFMGLTQSAPLNKRQDDGGGAPSIADFDNGVTGRFTWVETESYRFTGQFTRGFEKDTNIKNYEFFIVTKDGKKIDFIKDFRKNVKIYPAGGTSPFQKDYKGTVDKLVGGYFIIKHKGKKFSEALIKD